MEILHEIAISYKDRILLLDKDLSRHPIDLHQWAPTFYSWKGRHYHHLKQGPGWSFSKAHFPSPSPPQNAPLPQEPLPTPPPKPLPTPPQKPLPTPPQKLFTLSQEPPPKLLPPPPKLLPTPTQKLFTLSQEPLPLPQKPLYDVDIPVEVRRYFQNYETLIFPERSTR